MDVDPTLILQGLGPARRFADPDAPVEGRMMAARGALPLPPEQIASVLFALTFDPDPEVKARATQSLDELPDRVLDTALSAPVHPALLARFAERHRDDEARLEKIALNPATSDETFCLLAAAPSRRIVDIVAHNQTRLLRCPELVEALSENPATSQATIDRILSFLGLEVKGAEPPEDPVPEAPEPAAETALTGAEPFDPDDVEALPPDLLSDDDEPLSEEEAERRSRSVFAQIQDMNVMERVRLARFGNAEARGLLVRDRNKVVASAAIRSPKIKEGEVQSFAKSRNIADEVIRVIANTREWTKSYPIKLALATNPKTPVATAIKFVNYLTDRDLRDIMRSRDVPSQISQQARRILARKGKV